MNVSGTVSALSDGVHHVQVVNDSTVGLIIDPSINCQIAGLDGIGNTTISAGSVLTTDHIRQNALIIPDTGRAAIRPGGADASVSHVGFLTLTAAGTFDLADNDLVVNNGIFSNIMNHVLNGFGNTFGGIVSSTSDGSQILALFDNALVGAAEWAGLPIDANAIVGKYTYFGDANIDGQVTGDDYTIVDSNLNTTPPEGLGWLSGDVNLDGIVTGDDYTTIDSNLGLGAGNPLSANAIEPSALGTMAAVPEPGSVARSSQRGRVDCCAGSGAGARTNEVPARTPGHLGGRKVSMKAAVTLRLSKVFKGPERL